MSSGPILLIESSSRNCSVGASLNGEIIALREEIGEQFIHAEKLHLFAQEVLTQIKDTGKVSAVAVSNGPGSYTGLRIGLSLAKGMAYGLNCELITLSSLNVLFEAFQIEHSLECYDFFWPMLDARRMEVYTNGFDKNKTPVHEDRPMILDEELPLNKGICFGDGAEKAEELLIANGFKVVQGVIPTAKAMAGIAEEKLNIADFADKAYSEPFYLKAFQATQPRKKLI
jgi:tRNA threonylcarbamoyladenosine biosynthesis protein TsaB